MVQGKMHTYKVVLPGIALLLAAALSACATWKNPDGSRTPPPDGATIPSATPMTDEPVTEEPTASGSVTDAPATATPTPDAESLPYARYYIEVSLRAQMVYVYTTDDNGIKGELVHAMLCSTGRPGHETPIRKWVVLSNEIDQDYVDTGGFQSSYDFEWLNGGAAQYLTRMWVVQTADDGTETYAKSSYLFHSVPYEQKGNRDSLKTEEWNKLGTPASDGCIRLCVRDAKWIYTHVAPFSYVYTVEGTEDPLLWQALKLPALDAGVTRDPTDTEAGT